MKKFIKPIVSLSALLVAVVLIISVVYTRLSFIYGSKARPGKIAAASAASALLNEKTEHSEAIDEENGTLFASLDDFIACLGEDNSDSGKISFWMPEAVPNDADLVSIYKSSEGTVFNYFLGRDYAPRPVEITRDDPVNVISLTTDDDLLDGLTHAAISKTYSYADLLNFNNVTDYESFAETLAESIGASYASGSSSYTAYAGDIYADVYDTSTQITTRYYVGQQRIFYLITGNQESIVYTYVPASMSNSEAELFSNIIEYTVNNDDINN